MRRLSRARKERQLRLQHQHERQANKARLERIRWQRRRERAVSPPPAAIRISAPHVFSVELEESRSDLFAFLARLRFVYAHAPAGTTLVIDFSRTSRFVSHGTLLFYAELLRLIEYGAGRVRLRCTLAANSRANQVLKQIGVFDVCGQHAHIVATLADVVHWRVARGHIVDNHICAHAIEAYEGQMAEPLIDGIFRGLGEAMTNAKHHAYIGVRKDDLNFTPSKEDWWMFSQARDGALSVVFCDLGVGIPVTLPTKRPGIYALLEKLGLAASDAACIAEAIKDSRTRTHTPGRGYGLGNIIHAVSGVPGSMVGVMSNRGFYVMRDGVTTTHDFKDSILGTLIFWRVPLNGGHGS
jgi:hypothetical protein